MEIEGVPRSWELSTLTSVDDPDSLGPACSPILRLFLSCRLCTSSPCCSVTSPCSGIPVAGTCTSDPLATGGRSATSLELADRRNPSLILLNTRLARLGLSAVISFPSCDASSGTTAVEAPDDILALRFRLSSGLSDMVSLERDWWLPITGIGKRGTGAGR